MIVAKTKFDSVIAGNIEEPNRLQLIVISWSKKQKLKATSKNCYFGVL